MARKRSWYEKQDRKHHQRRMARNKASVLAPLLGVLFLLFGIIFVLVALCRDRSSTDMFNWLTMGAGYCAAGLLCLLIGAVVRRIGEPKPVYRSQRT